VPLSMDGKLFLYSPAKNLIAFHASPCTSKCVVLVSGMTEGPMSLSYTTELYKVLKQHDWSLVMPVLSSSWNAYGTSSLQQDAQELGQLVQHLSTHQNVTDLILMGHSTGAQIISWFAAYGETSPKSLGITLHGLVLQAPASDRHYMSSVIGSVGTQKLCQLAREKLGNDKADSPQHGWMPRERGLSVPFTPYRFLSLISEGGDDDMFTPTTSSRQRSTSLPEPTPSSTISEKLKDIPIAVYLSGKDQFIPTPTTIDDYASFFKKWPSVTNLHIVPEANHGLNNLNKMQLDRGFLKNLVEWILTTTTKK
jgi:pimeloyl-ACP methyl ester carboxylesterase